MKVQGSLARGGLVLKRRFAHARGAEESAILNFSMAWHTCASNHKEDAKKTIMSTPHVVFNCGGHDE